MIMKVLKNGVQRLGKPSKMGQNNIKTIMNRLPQQLDIRFVKVKAHSGDKYNEQADQIS